MKTINQHFQYPFNNNKVNIKIQHIQQYCNKILENNSCNYTLLYSTNKQLNSIRVDIENLLY